MSLHTDPGANTKFATTSAISGWAESFEYKPLHHPDEIRVLNIQPRSRASSSSGLIATIQHVRLSALPLYTAVSWMWGLPGDLNRITVDGNALMIRANLHKIISHLQDEYQPRKIWVDAICIDQTSNEERNHQVQMMGQIYSNANYVVACLTTSKKSESKRLQREARDLQRILTEGQYLTDTSKYRFIFGNRYFTRRWVIQEIAQAQSVILSCDGYHLPMSVISDALRDSRLLSKREENGDFSAFSRLEVMAESRATRLCRIRPKSATMSMSLEELLYSHEAAECSDFRDRIYALLSLTSHAQLHLRVQYDISPVQLMLHVLHVCHTYEGLSMFRTLSFMCFLRQHLEVDVDDLWKIIHNSRSTSGGLDYTVRGTVRGKITKLQIETDVEQAALRMRNRSPALLLRPPIALTPLVSSDLVDSSTSEAFEIDQQDLAGMQRRPRAEVAGPDQCLFSFIGNTLREMPAPTSMADIGSPPAYSVSAGPVFAGLGSTKIQIGDEIWQFDRTPIAVIARKSYTGFTLVGRAFLIFDLSFEDKGDRTDITRKRFEDNLVWVKDGTEHKKWTPQIKVDIEGLYQLMTWVTLDL